jgi:hypothetical protein
MLPFDILDRGLSEPEGLEEVIVNFVLCRFMHGEKFLSYVLSHWPLMESAFS